MNDNFNLIAEDVNALSIVSIKTSQPIKAGSQVSYAQYKANPCKYLVKFEAGLFLLFMEFSIEFRPETVFSECGTCSFDHAHL